MASKRWHCDRQRNCLTTPGSGLHQMLQPNLLYKDLPEIVVASLGGASEDYPLGVFVDQIAGKQYLITQSVRNDIFMSGDRAYRDEISEYLATSLQEHLIQDS